MNRNHGYIVAFRAVFQGARWLKILHTIQFNMNAFQDILPSVLDSVHFPCLHVLEKNFHDKIVICSCVTTRRNIKQAFDFKISQRRD
jgi:hypothetical protein